MPLSSIFCIVLAWFVALGGAITGFKFLFDLNITAMVIVVLATLFASIGLIFYAKHRDPRCNGMYEIKKTPLDILGVLIA